MLLSILYLALFIYVGLLLARRAVPDGSAAVILPLGCGFGVSLLAVLPAVLALALGFTLPAVLLAFWAACCCAGVCGCAAWQKMPIAAHCGPASCRSRSSHCTCCTPMYCTW